MRLIITDENVATVSKGTSLHKAVRIGTVLGSSN